jgi:hypothetical protein
LLWFTNIPLTDILAHEEWVKQLIFQCEGLIRGLTVDFYISIGKLTLKLQDENWVGVGLYSVEYADEITTGFYAAMLGA